MEVAADQTTSYLYQDTPDFVDGLDGLPGSIKDIADPNAQNLMLRSITIPP
jgi:hypothetical protein